VGAEQAEKKQSKETVNPADGLTEVASVVVREKSADLPVQQSSKVAVVINRTAAKALELIIPQPVLTRADEGIE
jgi:ABC-type uncharacterized transport system substrate-binding protein